MARTKVSTADLRQYLDDGHSQADAARRANPDCRAQTSGPQLKVDASLSVGVAAHITAAASGGPRHDATLTPGQRSSAKNGVWLCQVCAKLVDSDVERYPVEVLEFPGFCGQ